MEVTVDEIITAQEVETMRFYEGDEAVREENKTVWLEIKYTVRFNDCHKLEGQITTNHEGCKDMSITNHEQAIKQMIIDNVENSKGV